MTNADERVVFIVGTEREQHQIHEAGYPASVVREIKGRVVKRKTVSLYRQECRENGIKFKDSIPLIILEDYAANVVYDQIRMEPGVVVPHIVMDADEARDALTAGGARLADFLSRERTHALDTHQQVLSEAVAEKERENREFKATYLKAMGVHDVFDVALELASGQADREKVPTGLDAIDGVLGGGLPIGSLVTLGATSSTGKTTLALQIADNIAAAGRPVLFVTVEQGRHELVSKSISRLMRLQDKRGGGWFSVGASEIQSAKARKEWDKETTEAFERACSDYSSTIAPNFYMMELEEQPKVDQIREAAVVIRQHNDGVAPVVFVDYMQLLAPIYEHMTDRQAVDANVMKLRHIARDIPTCVFAISSLNRGSYSTGVTLEAFKESGAIEYGSDVLLGMQPLELAPSLEKVSEAKQRRTARAVERDFKSRANRELALLVLKNRSGAVYPDGVPLEYSAVGNLFTCPQLFTCAPGKAAKKKSSPVRVK